MRKTIAIIMGVEEVVIINIIVKGVAKSACIGENRRDVKKIRKIRRRKHKVGYTANFSRELRDEATTN